MIFESISHVARNFEGKRFLENGFFFESRIFLSPVPSTFPPAFDRKSEFSVRKAEGETGGWKETEEV